MNLTKHQETALGVVRELGTVFKEIVEKKTGKPVEIQNPIMNGLAAYQMLNLKGEIDYLDEAIDIVMRIVYEEVIKTLGDNEDETE